MSSSSRQPSKTGVAKLTGPATDSISSPQPTRSNHSGLVSKCQPLAAAQPRWVSRTCPTFMRDGTPSGFSTMSTGVPSSRNGMSSSGRILEMTPLLPWRPASLSPSEILRLLGDEDADHVVDARLQVVAVRAREALDADDDAAVTVGHLQRGVAHLARLLTEDRAEQALLGGQLGLTLRGDLADEDVARLDLGPDADDALLVEVGEHLLGDVRDVAGDLLGTELGLASVDLELLDVDRGQHVLADEPLGEDDRVLEVVTLPGHEGDEQVAAERELAGVGRRTVGEDVADLDPLPLGHHGPLVDAAALVGALELGEVVAVDLVVVGADHEVVAGDLDEHARRASR